jgi:hypothetical protein
MLIIIGSSVSVFILCSITCILLLGYCCCLNSARYKYKLTAERNPTPVTENPSSSVPIYEDLLPVSIKSTGNELNLKENVAYNSIEIKWHSNSPA